MRDRACLIKRALVLTDRLQRRPGSEAGTQSRKQREKRSSHGVETLAAETAEHQQFQYGWNYQRGQKLNRACALSNKIAESRGVDPLLNALGRHRIIQLNK